MKTSNPELSLQKLVEGNKRFITGHTKARDLDYERKVLIKGQKPHSIIVTCSDSRVVPEYIFDAGLGELFIIRTAGNLVDKVVLSSIEFAAEHLSPSLLVIMGHEFCGAVNDACQSKHHEGYSNFIFNKMRKAVELGEGNPERVVYENVRCVLNEIKSESEGIGRLLRQGSMVTVGAVYLMSTGRVDWILN